MVQRKLLVSDLTLGYDGLFDSADLFKLIDDWFKQKGYDKNEQRHIERVREKGKFIDYIILPYKKVSDYIKYEIEVKVLINDMVNKDVKKNGKTLNLNKGNISITLSAFVVSDISETWESRPMFFFLRTLYDKFVNKRFMDQYDKALMDDVQELHTELKAYLNLSKNIVPS